LPQILYRNAPILRPLVFDGHGFAGVLEQNGVPKNSRVAGDDSLTAALTDCGATVRFASVEAATAPLNRRRPPGFPTKKDSISD
jgi:hypothetical protein